VASYCLSFGFKFGSTLVTSCCGFTQSHQHVPRCRFLPHPLQFIIYSLILFGRLDDWLTVHRRITLVHLQLDAQNSYLFIYNTFIKILFIFRALPCSSSGGLRRNCIYAASGIVTVCRWLSCAPVEKELVLSQPVHRTLTCRQLRYQRLHIYNYDVDLLKMSRAMLETCRGF